MRQRLSALIVVVAAATIAVMPMRAEEKGGIDLMGPYELVENWLKPVADGIIIHPVGVFAESPDRIFIALTGVSPAPPPGVIRGTFDPTVPGARVDHQLFVVNRDGKVIEEWSKWPEWDGLIGEAHAVRISPYDSDKHVWFLDRASEQVYKFSHDGKHRELTLGEKGVSGSDQTHFNHPTEIAFLPDGTFYIADGELGRRIVKFDRDGKFVLAWGSEGAGPGQFAQQIHCVAVDARWRVYVGDLGNHRVQIFDENGKYLDQWPNIPMPMHIQVAQDQSVWVTDGMTGRIAKYDTNGRLLTYWGAIGRFPGAFNNGHDFSVDAEGNLYVVNGLTHVVDKFRPKAGADRSRLVGLAMK